MRMFLPICVLLLVVSSGCTVPILNIDLPGLPDIPGFGDTVVQQEHDVIVINSFDAYPDEIDAGGTTKLIAYIQNIGDADVYNVQVDLFDYCQGLFTPRLLTCGPEEYQVLAGDNPDTPGYQGYTKCNIKRILSKQIVPVIWSVCQNRAEAVKVKTVCPPDGMKMSVRYNYTTTSLTTIQFISLEEMQRQMIERTYDTTNSYISLGQGPIKPVVTVEDKQPIPVFSVNPGGLNTNQGVPDARTVLKLQLKNMGSGQLDTKVPVTMESGGTRDVVGIKESSVKVSLTDDVKPIDTKDEPMSDACYFMSSAWGDDVVRLVGKESSPYYCKIDVASLKGSVTTETSRVIRASVSYDYLLTKNVFVTVNPKIAA